MSERRWHYADDPHMPNFGPLEHRLTAEPKHLYGLDRLMYRPWQPTLWQRLFARLLGWR